MSGGSMDYLYCRVQDAAFADNTPLRIAFREHLAYVAAALRAIEWNDSGDGDKTEDACIRACLGDAKILASVVDQAHAIAKVLREELERACRGHG
jgi:hypothetical protein